MVNYRVVFTKSANKEFDHLPKLIKEELVRTLQFLATDPTSELLPLKRLRGGPATLYRLRLGDYRLVYDIQKNELIVLVIKIGYRRDVYRRLSF